MGIHQVDGDGAVRLGNVHEAEALKVAGCPVLLCREGDGTESQQKIKQMSHIVLLGGKDMD